MSSVKMYHKILHSMNLRIWDEDGDDDFMAISSLLTPSNIASCLLISLNTVVAIILAFCKEYTTLGGTLNFPSYIFLGPACTDYPPPTPPTPTPTPPPPPEKKLPGISGIPQNIFEILRSPKIIPNLYLVLKKKS